VKKKVIKTHIWNNKKAAIAAFFLINQTDMRLG